MSARHHIGSVDNPTDELIRLHHELAALTEHVRSDVARRVDDARLSATWYAYGRQDAERGAPEAVMFGLKYAVHVAQFETSARTTRMSVQGAYGAVADGRVIDWYQP